MKRFAQVIATVLMALAMPATIFGSEAAAAPDTASTPAAKLARAAEPLPGTPLGQATAVSPAAPLGRATALSPAAPLSPATPNADDLQAEDVADFQISINDLEPRVVTNHDSVRICGTLTSKSETLKDIQLNLYVRGDSMVTIPQTDAYLAGETYAGDYIKSTKISELKAGQTRDFSITVPTDDLPFMSDFYWGPRGLEITASAGDMEAYDRTLLLWDSGYEVEPTRLSVVSMISESVIDTSDGVVSTTPTVAQKNLAMKLADTNGVTLAVGAGLLESEQFSSALAKVSNGPIISLPAADADVAGIAHLNEPSQLPRLVKDSKSVRNLDVASDAGLEILDSFVIPEIDQLDLQTVRTWADQTIIARGTGLGPIEVLTYDPSTWTRFDTDTGESVAATFSADEGEAGDGSGDAGTDVLIAHNTLTELLGRRAHSPDEELDIQQMIRATTAVITRQLPNQARTMVALTSRNADEPEILDRVNAALGERWVKPLNIGDAIAESGESTPRTSLPDYVATEGSITDAEMHTLQEAIESTAAMTSALEDSTGIVTRQRSRVLLASALALRQEPRLRSALKNGVVEEANQLATSVKVEQSAPINVLDQSARLPVRVSSTLEEPVNAIVELVPSDPRLQVDEGVEVQIPAKSATIVEIPVRAVGSGNVLTQVKVKGPNGLIIDDDTQIQVRVRAEWENKGMAVAAVLLGILLVVGIARTVKRGRRVDMVDGNDSEDGSGERNE
ncbi:MAG TPA: hypothetical protein GX000_08290 [Actinomyces sp.]|nr:hypothetical protein [Actinomyces sp.]